MEESNGCLYKNRNLGFQNHLTLKGDGFAHMEASSLGLVFLSILSAGDTILDPELGDAVVECTGPLSGDELSIVSIKNGEVVVCGTIDSTEVLDYAEKIGAAFVVEEGEKSTHTNMTAMLEKDPAVFRAYHGGWLIDDALAELTGGVSYDDDLEMRHDKALVDINEPINIEIKQSCKVVKPENQLTFSF